MTLDIEEYIPYLEGLAMSRANKEQMIRIVWGFMESHIDQAFGLHPVQQAQNCKRKSIHIRSAISEAGGILKSPSIEFGEDSDSRLVEHLLASVAAHQREKNAEQVKNRMRARVLNGYCVTAPVIGYRYEKVEGHGKLLVRDEPVASIIQEVLEGFAHGRFGSQAEVKRFLEGHAAYPKGSDGEVHWQRVTEMFRRVVYAGRLSMPDWGIHNHPAQHEALVSYETWQKIQGRLNKPKRAPIRKDINADFPLRGFVTCGCCGHPMTSCWSKGSKASYAYYLCFKKGCEHYKKSIPRDKLEGEFAALISDFTPPRQLFVMAVEMLHKLWDDRSDKRKEEEAHLEVALDKTERQIGQLLDRIVDAQNASVVTAYETRIQALEDEKIVLREKIEKCGCALPDFSGTFRTALKFLANPHEL